MRCVLGIDSGGTKCDAILVRDDGIVVGWGHCDVDHPESGRAWGGSGRSPESVQQAVREALEGIECEELHITGPAQWVPIGFLGRGQRVRIEVHGRPGEGPAALALIGETSGVVVLAGTGANVYARTRDGRESQLDGMGPMLGDYGGGYQIGSLAVRAAAKAAWHPRHQTSLALPIYRACGAGEGDAAVSNLAMFMHQPHDRAEIASFTKLVNIEAEAGDRVAREILEQAAAAIAETVRDLVDRLDIAGEEYVMAGTGGVIRGSRIYWQHLCALVAEFAPRLKPLVSDMPAVVGVVLPTLRRLASVDRETLEGNLFRSMREVLSGRKH